MATRVHRPLKVLALNANSIGRQRYELSKQLQKLHVDEALFSETYLKPHERSFIPNSHFHRTDRYPGRKGGTAIAVRKGIPHNHVDLPPLVSVEATGFCIPVGNSEVLLAAFYKSPSRAWSDIDITELLSFRPKSILAGDLTLKTHFGIVHFETLQVTNCYICLMYTKFKISAPQCPVHYSPNGNGDVLVIVVHQKHRNVKYYCF
jgi:hypothetical protein